MKKIIVTLLVLIFIGLAILFGYNIFVNDNSNLGFNKKPEGNLECVTSEYEYIVNGDSLTGVISNGSAIVVLKDFYNCNEVKRDDIIVYNYAEDQNPLVKFIKGLPGDTFSLKQNNNGFYNIIINNEIATNFSGTLYALSDSKKNMLALFEKNTKGVIPQGSYLILGNNPAGSFDSTRIGLVGQSGIIGKVVR